MCKLVVEKDIFSSPPYTVRKKIRMQGRYCTEKLFGKVVLRNRNVPQSNRIKQLDEI